MRKHKAHLKKKEPVRNKSGGEAVVEADLGSVGVSDGGEIGMSSQEKTAVDEEGSGSGSISGDGGDGGSLGGENGGLHSLGFGDTFAETPGFSQPHHCCLLLESWI